MKATRIHRPCRGAAAATWPIAAHAQQATLRRWYWRNRESQIERARVKRKAALAA
jgi:hypothetical protein